MIPFFICIIIALVVIIGYLCYKNSIKNQILDVDGMENHHNLSSKVTITPVSPSTDEKKPVFSAHLGDWIQIGSVDLARLEITDQKISYESGGNTISGTYSLRNSSISSLKDGKDFKFECPIPYDLVYHRETIGGAEYDLISGTMFEEDGRGLIVVAEFAKADDIKYFAPDFRSEFNRLRNDAPPIPASMMIDPYADNILDCIDWIGKEPIEIGIADEAINKGETFHTFSINGQLANKSFYGKVYLKTPKGQWNDLVDTIYFHSKEFDFEDCRDMLVRSLGLPYDEGEEPYVEINGGAVLWCDFITEYGVRLRVSKASNYDYLDITISKMKQEK